MKKHFIAIGLVTVFIIIILSSMYASPPGFERYLVNINPARSAGIMKAIIASGGRVEHVYNLLPDWIAVRVPGKALKGIFHIPGIFYTEKDGAVRALQQALPWGVDKIDAERVHPDNKGTGIPVAVLDTGIDYYHPDLDANYKGGYDFVNGDDDPLDDNGHGTHAAGTVAAEDNELGIIGAAPEAFLYAVKVLDVSGNGYYSDIIAALDWCVSNNIAVANMSLGGNFRSRALEQACNNAYNAGVLLVAAAGNDNSKNIFYPARFNSVIAVGAVDENNERAWFSNYGSAIELAAPGMNILSPVLNSSYEMWGGTSMAAPHVAGTAALVIASGVINNSDVRARLQNTAEDLGEPGKDNYFGYGLVDAEAAVSGIAPPPPPPPEEEVVAITKSLYDSKKLELSVEAVSSDAPAGASPAAVPVLTITGNPVLPGEPFEMEYNSIKGKYSAKIRGVLNKPDEITVLSSHGGSAATQNIDNKFKAVSAGLSLQVYPNPFNPETTIKYSVDNTVPVSIKIYNELGQVVRTLINETQNSGKYTAVWNGRDEYGHQLSSGIYYCRLSAGSASYVLNISLVK